MTWSRRTTALRALLKRLERNPLVPGEQQELEALLLRLEADVEALGAQVASERADVERLSQPLLRFALFVTGQLGTREAKEQGEYQSVLARTMALGDRASLLRTALETVGAPTRLTDEAVVEAFAGVKEADLAKLPYPLRPLHMRCAASEELAAIRSLCDLELAAHGLKPTPQWLQARRSEQARIEGRLRRAGFAADPLPSEPDAEALAKLRAALDAAIAAHVDGLAAALREVVRAARFPALTA